MKWSLFCLLFSLCGCDQGDLKYRNIGVTKQHIADVCERNFFGKCEVLQSKIAFYFHAPKKFVGMPSEQDYDHYVGVPLYVEGSTISTTSEQPKHKIDHDNYIVGTPVQTVIVRHMGRGLDTYLDYLNTLRHADYTAVRSDILGYKKYDDRLCDQLVFTGEPVDEELVSIRCGDQRQVIYVPENATGISITCWQLMPGSKVRRITTCEVRSLMTKDSEARYNIRLENFLDGSWVEQNTRIVDFLSPFISVTK